MRAVRFLVTLSVVAATAVGGVGPAQAAPPWPDVTVDRVLARDLATPWGVAFLPDGSALVSERGTARIKRIPAGGGAPTRVGRVRGVVPNDEGGLLGIAVPPGPDPRFLFAYYSGARDNRVVRIGWDGRHLGKQTPILTGIPHSSIHNGGRLLIGPGDTLFVSTGEAGVPSRSQDRHSLGGKILHITFDGRPAPGNPFRGSPVYSLGHRNVQGLAFDSAGRLWASEFGQSDVDELNLIKPGGNYGWPVHEGASSDSRYVNPKVQWSPTAIASPSGIAIVDDVVYVASLRGERLWQVVLDGVHASKPHQVDIGDHGRLRNVALAPDGSLWLFTNNTDGRGTPRPHDDQILKLTVGDR